MLTRMEGKWIVSCCLSRKNVVFPGKTTVCTVKASRFCDDMWLWTDARTDAWWTVWKHAYLSPVYFSVYAREYAYCLGSARCWQDNSNHPYYWPVPYLFWLYRLHYVLICVYVSAEWCLIRDTRVRLCSICCCAIVTMRILIENI